MKKVLSKLILSAALGGSMLLSSHSALAESYVIDTKGAHAYIQFKIKHLG